MSNYEVLFENEIPKTILNINLFKDFLKNNKNDVLNIKNINSKKNNDNVPYINIIYDNIDNKNKTNEIITKIIYETYYRYLKDIYDAKNKNGGSMINPEKKNKKFRTKKSNKNKMKTRRNKRFRRTRY
jgi:hypothetical protein